MHNVMATVNDIKTISAHKNDINCCVFSSNGKAVVSASADKTTRIFNVENGEEFSFSPLLGHTYSVTACAFSPLGSILVTGSQDCSLILWNVETGEKVKALFGHKGIVRCCSFSAKLPYLVTCSSDTTIMVWNFVTYKLLKAFKGSEFSLTTCRFTPDDLYIVSGSIYGDLRVWDFNLSKCMKMVQAHDCGSSGVGLSSCDFSPKYGAASPYLKCSGGESACFLLATCGGDNLVKLWHLYTASAHSAECSIQPLSFLEGHSAHVSDCKFSFNGEILASCSTDKSVILWDPICGKIIATLTGHTRYINCIAFSPDGSYLASGSNDKTMRIWKLELSEQYQKSPDPVNINKQILHNPKSVSCWTVDEVCVWLRLIGLELYINTFTVNAINGAELVQLDDDGLSKGLHIEPLGHRNKILREIKQIKLVGSHNDIPDEFLCPITLELMTDPVLAADGFTYEKASISSWLTSGKVTSPMTNIPLAHTQLVPNRSLKNAIIRFFGPAPLILNL